jgi:hypothetical protein
MKTELRRQVSDLIDNGARPVTAGTRAGKANASRASGVTVTAAMVRHLASASRLALAYSLAWSLPWEHLTGLSLLVDPAGVVHRIAVSLSGTDPNRPASENTMATSLTVTFSGIGQPQRITAPASFTNVHLIG